MHRGGLTETRRDCAQLTRLKPVVLLTLRYVGTALPARGGTDCLACVGRTQRGSRSRMLGWHVVVTR